MCIFNDFTFALRYFDNEISLNMLINQIIVIVFLEISCLDYILDSTLGLNSYNQDFIEE